MCITEPTSNIMKAAVIGQKPEIMSLAFQYKPSYLFKFLNKVPDVWVW